MAITRAGELPGGYWAQGLLVCYGWFDVPYRDGFLGNLPFLTSSYRPPEILRAIARDPNRGTYLATSRRTGLQNNSEVKESTYPGDSIRRDVYYTPEFTMATMAYDPDLGYDVTIMLFQTMGVTFASELPSRIVVTGTGFYASRQANGITGTGVSIIARDPKAEFGEGRFMSNGTRIFITSGDLWQHRQEDPSGWIFTQVGDAYPAIRPATGGYTESEDPKGYYLELEDMWAPVVIQMGRAADYESFEAFQNSVKKKPFTYKDGKLSYVSEAGETFEVWSEFKNLPTINGKTVNLNPPKTFNSPFLSMEHGSNKAVISHPGHEDVVLEF